MTNVHDLSALTRGIFLVGAAGVIAFIAAPATAQQIPDTAFAPPIGH